MSNKKRKQDVAYNDFYEWSEKDFYPPSDDRIITSGVEEVYDGEYSDFLKDFYNHISDY